MDELSNRIIAWVDKHEMRYNAPGWILKLMEEVGELSGAFVKGKGRAEEEGELADSLICLLIVAACLGIDPVAAAHAKMAINEARTGRVNAMGIFVKSADLS